MSNGNRMQKINEELMRELSRLVFLLKDPRIHGVVSITHVEATRDLYFAKVFVSVLGGDSDTKTVVDVLKAASGFLRHELAASLQLRHTPQLQFIADDSIVRGAHIHEILSSLDKGASHDDT